MTEPVVESVEDADLKPKPKDVKGPAAIDYMPPPYADLTNGAQEYYVDPEAAKNIEDKTLLIQDTKLWDVRQTAWYSLLLTPIFGFYFQMLNWQTLEDKEQEKNSFLWLKISAGYILASFLVAPFLPPKIGWAVFKVMFIMYFVAWYLSNAKEQIEYVEKTFGKNYKRKPWDLFIYGSLGLVVIFILTLVIFSFFEG